MLALRVHSPLVFLSGCETGLGDAWSTAFQPGDDYATLAQALLYAGAGSVVATLWRIDDAATSTLARAFYSDVSGPSAEALARAQRAFLASGGRRGPYYWAAFEMHGAAPSTRDQPQDAK
jgi:CHAT domain-containing protein